VVPVTECALWGAGRCTSPVIGRHVAPEARRAHCGRAGASTYEGLVAEPLACENIPRTRRRSRSRSTSLATPGDKYHRLGLGLCIAGGRLARPGAPDRPILYHRESLDLRPKSDHIDGDGYASPWSGPLQNTRWEALLDLLHLDHRRMLGLSASAPSYVRPGLRRPLVAWCFGPSCPTGPRPTDWRDRLALLTGGNGLVELVTVESPLSPGPDAV
jgi:hypothetical protein